MGKSKGAVSGGTVASMLLAVEQGITDPVVEKVLNDPYGLYPSESAWALTAQINEVFAGTRTLRVGRDPL